MVSFGVFLKSNLAFAVFKLPGNKLSLIERLQSGDIGLAKISTPSFRNSRDMLTMPAASGGFKPFKIFNIFPGIFQKIQNLSL